MAKPVPGLPLGGSTMVPPGLRWPSRSAALDQAQRVPAFDRAPGVECLDLRHELRREPGADAGQTHQRRLADRVEDRVLDGGRIGGKHGSSVATFGCADNYQDDLR